MSAKASALPLAALLLLAPRIADAEPPVVVELYTSQGCDTCPPADAYLGELARRTEVLALGFHVDYWNYIGWTDPFARHWASERQRQYLDTLKTRYVYTPQMVVNGTAEGVGAERETIEALIRAAAARRQPQPDLTLKRRDDGALIVRVGEFASAGSAVLWLLGYDRPHRTEVLRGENEGRSAVDYQVVCNYRRLAAWSGRALEAVVPPDEARELGTGGAAVLLQLNGQGPILAAVRLDFPIATAR